ncbi:MAG: YtxH domain-containing protein [Polyangiaceae bacterium]|nr:YtxH domain-containing protein [Polyangiaceae bacterium]
MKARDIVSYFSDAFPLRRRSSTDWVLPASIALGVGLAAGVGIGVLIAPQPGDVTRRQLKESAGRARERAREVAGKQVGSFGQPEEDRSSPGQLADISRER